jgi:hypothetical protein
MPVRKQCLANPGMASARWRFARRALPARPVAAPPLHARSVVHIHGSASMVAIAKHNAGARCLKLRCQRCASCLGGLYRRRSQSSCPRQISSGRLHCAHHVCGCASITATSVAMCACIKFPFGYSPLSRGSGIKPSVLAWDVNDRRCRS